jgi:GT2 family glycosyltransferase
VIAFVNPDVVLHHTLTSLWKLEGGINASIVAAHLLPSEGERPPNARPEATLFRELLKALIGSRAYALPPTRSAALERVAQVDGALMMIPRTTFDVLGGFDSQFELYYEDVDLCWRANSLGGVYFTGSPWGMHEGGVSSVGAGHFAYCAGRVSRVRYLRKRYPRRLTGIWACGIAVVEFLARSAARSPEGIKTRATGLRLQLAEVGRPGSVQLLPATGKQSAER